MVAPQVPPYKLESPALALALMQQAMGALPCLRDTAAGTDLRGFTGFLRDMDREFDDASRALRASTAEADRRLVRTLESERRELAQALGPLEPLVALHAELAAPQAAARSGFAPFAGAGARHRLFDDGHWSVAGRPVATPAESALIETDAAAALQALAALRQQAPAWASRLAALAPMHAQ